MNQPTITDLAQRGAPCKPWVEWCKKRLINIKGTPNVSQKIKVVSAHLGWGTNHIYSVIGPLPSCTYLDDQLGEFFDKAGAVLFKTGLVLNYSLEVAPFEFLKLVNNVRRDVPLIQKLEAAIIIVERAHRIGENMHLSETEAAPYMAAFLRGIGG